MSELILPQPLLRIAESGKITPSDVLVLRREVFSDDLVTKAEAEALLALDLATHQKCPEWSDYFSQALVHYIVYQADPEGLISKDNANWLIQCISRDGLVDSPERLEMLIKVIEEAKVSPEFLQKFALYQVFKAIVHDEGALTQSRVEKQQVICSRDVELIRRLLFAFGGEGGMAVTKSEAEFLFELNDATLAYENDNSWSDLFVKAIGNYLMATLGNATPIRTVAFEKAPEFTFDASLNSMVNLLKSSFDAMKNPFSAAESAIGERNEDIETAYQHASEVTETEAKWVIDRIGRDGLVHDNEKALLQFLKDESAHLHPRLDELLKKAG